MKKKLLSLFFSFFLIAFIFSFFGLEQSYAAACKGDSDCTSDEYCQPEPLLKDGRGFCMPREESDVKETKTVEIDLAKHLTLSGGQRVDEVFAKPSDLVNLIVRVVFVAAGLIIFMMVVMAGVSMIAGKDGKNLEQAKTTMTNAGLGFLIIFAAYWIMQLIAMITGAAIGF